MNSFHSIRDKLLMLVFVSTASALLVAGTIFLINDLNDYRTTRTNDLNTQIELLAYSTTAALQFEDRAVAQENLELLRLQPTVQAAAIYTARGSIFASYVRAGTEHVLPELPGEDGIERAGTSLRAFSRIIDNGEILGTAYISGDYQLGERILRFVRILLLVALGALMMAAVVCLWLQSFITRPIQSIAGIAREVVERKEYGKRAEKLTDDEVGVLVDSFNEMMQEISNRTQALERSNAELGQESQERKRYAEQVQQLNAELEQKVMERTHALQATNAELETFCYTVSHDLRGPLRAISGFSQALREELPAELPGDAARYFDKIVAASHRMGQLIEDLLNLSRVSRGELSRQDVDFSALAREVARDLQNQDVKSKVEVSVWDGIIVDADPKLLRIVLENLMGNSWKFTGKQAQPRIEVGSMKDRARVVYFVRDNGVGFDMKYSDKLFGAFQRLHGMNEFPGTGIGLATVHRIINRHGGSIWFDSAPGNGAIFYFTLKHEQGTAQAERTAQADA